MKRTLLISLCAVVICSIYFFSNQKDDNQTTSLISGKKTDEVEVNIISTPFVKETAIVADKPSVKSDIEPSFYAINKLSEKAQSVLSEAGVLPSDLNNEAYIEFDLPSLQELEAGDNFELMIPQSAETFIAEVTFIDVASNGDKSIFGNVTGADGRFHTTVLTVGKDAVYGQLTAPSGNYVFESKDQYGWIAAKRDLYRKHVEFEHSESEHHSDAQHTEQEKTDIFAPKFNNTNK
ncbi:hypothetical protein [Pseudoalteromonas phenolica]|uniref:Uncharacterized protein n=1 Tax=Pseudoalteromonas phenolica TaxID=161398 RepID=A0A0S2K8C0_9GAMM|nr:hypothetical protein [Pseudoalteromonas phenolica]ALO44382.1 hypothetical protein PP2015_3914 [Pseudoalteromonas phenolica]MBE0357394.1 hypothetical protein [Pseudoalteromonas phenolica O-BC30]RXF01506.1 hypothetical protein D9981_08715 [Pseudoalteromonas phenolica O-BC30]